jgi:hypothetical protein
MPANLDGCSPSIGVTDGNTTPSGCELWEYALPPNTISVFLIPGFVPAGDFRVRKDKKAAFHGCRYLVFDLPKRASDRYMLGFVPQSPAR